MVIVVVGSYFMYDDDPWDYAAIGQLIGSQLMEISRKLDLDESFQVIFLSGNSTEEGGNPLQVLEHAFAIHIYFRQRSSHSRPIHEYRFLD